MSQNPASPFAPALAAWLYGRLAGRGGAANTAATGAGHCELSASAGGFSNVTWMGTWQPAGAAAAPQPIVVRLQSAQASVFPDVDITRQYRVMQALAATPVPVPRLLGEERSSDVIGAPFYVMERVAGRVPNENPLYHLEGWFHDLGEAALRRHWFSGIDTLAAIAKVDWRGCGLAEVLAPPPGVATLEHQLQGWHHMMVWAESLGRPYPHLHAGWRWLREHAPAEGPLALSWGDAKLGNCVFTAGGQVAAALDWEQAALSHPVDDLAWWLMLDESLSTGYGVPRLTGLPTREETVAHWEQRSGFSARELPYYDVFAAWRMACIMARIGTIFTHRGWVPESAQMDVRNGGAALLARHAQRLGF